MELSFSTEISNFGELVEELDQCEAVTSYPKDIRTTVEKWTQQKVVVLAVKIFAVYL